MIDLLKTARLKNRRITSALGLALDGTRLEGAVVKRTNDTVEVRKTFAVTLSLDPLTAEPELVGREIRNHLDAAGIREKVCVFGLPLKWALTAHAELPPMAEADAATFLQLEAERGFHSDVTTLHYAASRSQMGDGKEQALLVGIPRAHLQSIASALEAARLQPVSFSFALTALQPALAGSPRGVLAFAIGDTSIGLEIAAGGGIAALRAIEGAIHAEGNRRVIDSELIAREARITLGQLPASLREGIASIRVFGPRDLGQQLADELELRFESLGLKAEVAVNYPQTEFGLRLAASTPVSPAVSLAAALLAGHQPPFELLPPKISRWQQLATRYSSGKLSTAGAAAGALVLLVLIAFLVQQWQLSRLRSQWSAMASKVKQLDGVEEQIRQYRPWYDESFGALSILRQLTSAFPETGVVSARSVEIRDLNAVTCTGTTQDPQALLAVLDKLRANRSITDVRMGTMRGNKPPMQFSFDFHYTGGGALEN
ncbi:MAG TPA: hypothetical protein VHH88_04400 [Verrucomicrobiae bacterium]|nr:hypothetical protein [Verrucomicrobiae bacterium]